MVRKKTASGRITFIAVCMIVFSLAAIGRLYALQIISNEEFSARASRQYVRSTYDYYNRGSIFFETKDGERRFAASLRIGYILAIKPSQIKDPEDIYLTLIEVVPTIDREDFMMRAARKDRVEERLARRLNYEEAKLIEGLKLPGVELIEERWRSYPNNSLAAHAIGFIGYGGEEELSGRYGLERYYENVLGRNNDSVYKNFFVEIFSGINDMVSGSDLEGDVIITIEPSVQAYLEDRLKNIDETWDADFTGGIVINPMNGEIYAMAIEPAFDPNDVRKERSLDIFQNKLIENVFEMGSIIKPLTIAAGLDSGAITRNTTYFDRGSITVNGRTISNYDGRGRGEASMQMALDQSLNTGMAFIVGKMGNKAFADYMKKFGLGSETGIDLPNEAHGLIDNLNSPRDIEYATASFGQGIATTPIATVRALSALANGGTLIEPRLAKSVNYRIGGSKKIVPNPGTRVISEETSEEITRMLVHVVDKALLGGTVKMDRYSIAAKTGTAQIASSGGYHENQYLHSFFGYFPAFEPRFLVFLFTYHPKGASYASETLTHGFLDITRFLINYYEVPPDR